MRNQKTSLFVDMKEKVRSIIEVGDSKASRVFDVFIQLLILSSLVTFSIETLPDLTVEQKLWLNRVEAFMVFVFSVEYLLRIWVAEKKTAFVFSFFGIIDLLAILPFYLSFGIDLRSIRIFRLMRLFRLFKLVRYNAAISRYHYAFRLIKEELILFLSISIFTLYCAAVGIYFFENEAQPEVFSSIFSSLWWAVATLTTVGYGDIFPITLGGKVFTFFVLFIGLGIVAVPAGLISSALGKTRDLSNEDIDRELEKEVPKQ